MSDVELERIGPYTIISLESMSSTSSFYQGKRGKKDVTIKRLNIPLSSVEAREAFQKRAGQLKKLKHRSILDTSTFDFDGDFGYLVQEHREGETLRNYFASNTTRPPADIRAILSPVADALQYAHVQNTLHANLHPGSLKIDERKNPFITEFSLSTPEVTLDDEAFAIPYMAPEHLQGLPVAASDQYALAVMVYEWLCGRRPFEATERELLLEQQEKTSFPTPGSINTTISPLVERVLTQALAYKPEERFSTVQAFADAYLKALMNVTIVPSAKARPTAPVIPRKIVIPPAPVADEDIASVGAQFIAPSSPLQHKSNGLKHVDTQPDTPISSTQHKDVDPVGAQFIAPILPITEEEQAVGAQFIAPTKKSAPLVNNSRLQSIVSDDLRQGGVLSQQLSGYEERLAQIEMASIVARALNQNVPAIIEAATGTGKALDVDTPIPTPDGWKKMGDLVTGDYVFDEKGYPTRVTRAFDVMHDRPCYEVLFSDGSSLIADAEHEWASYTCTDRKHGNQLLTNTYTTKRFVTAEKLSLIDQLILQSKSDHVLSTHEAVTLIGGHQWSVFQATRTIEPIGKKPARYPRETLLTAVQERLTKDLSEQRRDGRAYTLITTEQMAATLTFGSAKRANHAIAVTDSLLLPDINLPIAPYFLGCWLGDGCSYNSQITTTDPDIITEIEKDGYTVRPLKSRKIQYAIDDENGKAKSRWQPGMKGRLRSLGLRLNKHIPGIYLRASVEQRRALLAGLLDTDGTVNHCGAIEFTTTSSQLAEGTYELMCSLGFRPSIRCGRAKLAGKDCGPKWTLAFTTDKQVFRLERKIASQKERLRNYNPERNRFRYVVAINKVPSRPVRCIQIESESHLYLAGKAMIPTHNSLAYLVPAVRSGKVAIISTANKALQEQLFYKDIPFVQKHIKDFAAALVKGVGNYVCIDRLESERTTGMQLHTKNADFKRLVDITNDPDSTFMGDFETLGFQLPNDIRNKVATDSDQCAWSKCNYFADCYVREMREQAEIAQIIVVNHTLLLLDAAIGGFLLPERDVIILDEAHHLEEEATHSFTITIGPAQIQTLLNQRTLRNHSQLSLQNDAMEQSTQTWARLAQVADPGFKGRANLEAPLEEGLKLATVISDLADSLRKQRPKDLPEKEGQLYDKLLKRTQNLSENIRTVFSVAQPTKFVYYVERVQTSGQRGVQLQVSAAPLDVTSWLQEKLFKKCNVICTSATLATIGPNPAHPEEKGPNFGYFRRRIGLEKTDEPDEVLERILPLTFDYESNALLYIPRDLPEPTYGANADDYMKAIAREMYKLVKASRGRAFLLFSSKRMLERAYELMSPHLPYPLLKQGDMTRLELTRRFREEEGAVLFGLKSFWEGVDIAGEALSLVVIDKLPFDPPDDPVHEARVAQMKAAGENWFGTYVLPQAVLRLKQGLGRLLRTREDRGVMAILDTRLYTKGYGKMVLNALPPARRTASIRDVEHFFSE